MKLITKVMIDVAMQGNNPKAYSGYFTALEVSDEVFDMLREDTENLYHKHSSAGVPYLLVIANCSYWIRFYKRGDLTKDLALQMYKDQQITI